MKRGIARLAILSGVTNPFKKRMGIVGIESESPRLGFFCVTDTESEISQARGFPPTNHGMSVQRQTQCGAVKIPFSVFRFQNLEISSPLFSSPLHSCDSFYSWFTIFAFFEKDVIHESNAVFKEFA
jgi:hypothetical protein